MKRVKPAPVRVRVRGRARARIRVRVRVRVRVKVRVRVRVRVGGSPLQYRCHLTACQNRLPKSWMTEGQESP